MDISKNRKIRIGEVLQEFGYITEEQINQAVEYQKSHEGIRLGGALIEMGFITEKQMLEALAQRMEYETIDLGDITVDIEAVELIPEELAEKYCMMGFQIADGQVCLLVNDPMNFYGIEDIRQIVGMDLRIFLTEKEPLEKAIQYYYSEVSAKQAASRANASAAEPEVVEMNLEDAEDDTPIINLLNSLVLRAYNTNVSDIHIEPFEHHTMVRMRMDGAMTDYMTLQANIHMPLIARIKILGDLDIAERRVPQDGHFRTTIEGVNLNIRVSVIPTVFGEKAVLRLLANNSNIDHVGSFGMNEENYQNFREMLQSPHGIIYLTGPTGSGKSTTLYMVLEELSKRNVNISTIEDPVEKNVARLNQMQVNNQAGLTFEVGLRALLRQDPDIIMVGETRDAETAAISVRAAITGHMVVSTLHTNDAASSVVRLIDMGIEPYLLASSLNGIVAQRLVRKVCPNCVQEVPMTDEEVKFVGKRLPLVKKACGCNQCNDTGYRGRIAIHEILPIDKKIRRMITDGAEVEEIKEYAIQELGMHTLKDGVVDLLEQGITTMEEVNRVAYYD